MSKNVNSNYTEINGVNYFKFSGRIDNVHLYKDGGNLCGKPALSSNYASEKSLDHPICKECLEEAK